MRKRIVPTAIVLCALALPLLAQEAPPKGDDYSRDTLRKLFVASGDEEDKPQPSPFDTGFIFINRPGIRLRWLPIMAPILASYTSGSQAFGMPIVDPFALTGTTSFPATPAQARDRWRDWRERRTLRRFVAKANASDNN